jgi:hypothetical protein
VLLLFVNWRVLVLAWILRMLWPCYIDMYLLQMQVGVGIPNGVGCTAAVHRWFCCSWNAASAVLAMLILLLLCRVNLQVGVGIREDVRRIAADYGVITRSAVDLADVAKEVAPLLLLTQQQQATAAAAAAGGGGGGGASTVGSSKGGGAASLAGMCRLLLGVKVDKTLQVGNSLL